MNKPTHRFDEIRQKPVAFENVSQSIYRSYHILQEVKRMLAEYYNSDAILDIIALLETDLPNNDKIESDLEFARRVYGQPIHSYVVREDK